MTKDIFMYAYTDKRCPYFVEDYYIYMWVSIQCNQDSSPAMISENILNRETN